MLSKSFGQRSFATHLSAPVIAQKTSTRLVPPYAKLQQNLKTVHSILKDAPLTLAEKILYTHLHDVEDSLAGKSHGDLRGQAYLKLQPDRVAMQDASAQMALLQFSTCGADRTAVPTSVHCDHLISAFEGAEADLKRAVVTNKEVFDFLESASRKYGIEFWRPGSGIIHQIVLENYSAPGLLMLGTDSHTPNAGGLGAIAIGVGGADAVDAMTATPWELKAPRIIGVELTGQLSGWASPKDLVLHLVGRLTVRGGTGSIIEYYGPGAETLSATGMGTICNMGAEVGATTSLFPYSAKMKTYLQATGRDGVAKEADRAASIGLLSASQEASYDQHISIDLSAIEPHLNGPFTPDLSTPLSKFASLVKEKGWKDEISAGLIGSCTNSSYEDMGRVVSIAKQAQEKGLKMKTSFMATPGSELINATISRDGYTQTLEDVGAVVLSNACGPCIGQWDRKELKGEENAILTSFNRNFKGRNDGNTKTMNFLASPDLVTAMSFSGRLSFNPLHDELIGADGKPFRFNPPSADELPSSGFTPGDLTFLPSASTTPDPTAEIVISPTSSRLERLKAFAPHFSQSQIESGEQLELDGMKCLFRVRGKCTTDEISAAGPWLKFKGHLSNIAENTYIGAMNDQTNKVNTAIDYKDGKERTIPETAKLWRSRGQSWMLVGDFNFGEGSAREHAALQPRILGCKIICVRSFARIHETNLKKQGILPLTFKNPDDYKLISAGDDVSTLGLGDLLRGRTDAQLQLKVTTPSGETREIPVSHTMSNDQLEWLKAGSALNHIGAVLAEGIKVA